MTTTWPATYVGRARFAIATIDLDGLCENDRTRVVRAVQPDQLPRMPRIACSLCGESRA
jgi:hypothetical protein